MKIAIIVDSLDSKSKSGINSYIINLVSAILKIDNKNDYFLVHGVDVELNIEGSYSNLIIPYLKPKFLNILRNFFLGYKLNKFAFDIVHSPSHDGPFMNNYRFKKIITVHDIVNYLYPQHRKYSILVYLKNKIYFPILLRFCDEIISISNFTRNELIDKIKINPNKIIKIYNGINENFREKRNIDEAYYHEKYNIPEKFILFVSSIEPRKNLITLLRAYKNLIKEKKYQEYSVVIVGGQGWKNKDVYEFIEKNSLNEKVRIYYNLNTKELVDFYNLATIFVLPTLYEGFGLTPLEALRCGCPVITSNNSSLPEVVGNAALLLDDPLDHEKLAEMISELLSNSKLCNKLIQEGFKQAEKFSWDKAAEETIFIYEKVYQQYIKRK